MLFALKLFLTPTLITLATLAGRKWGPGVSDWLIGLPLTSGPISLILAVQYGTEYAVRASPGIICGQASVCIFCLVYSLAAYRMKWYTSALAAILSFSAVTFLWNRFSLALAATFVIVLVLIGLIYRLIPSQQAAGTVTHAPSWDIPARMLLATIFVVLITTYSLRLGPHLSGLIAPFPVFGLVLASFTHYQLGTVAAIKLLRGVVLGSFGFIVFFLVVGLALPHLGIVATYTLAALAAVLINGVLLKLAR